MNNLTVALCRVSSAQQRVDGNSLESQQKHVYEFSENTLNTGIDKLWSIDVSSKAGKNVTRKDLAEIRNYCKEHKYIKYFVVDKVNRLMREIKMFYWFIQELEFIGVRTYFADPQQQDLNKDDQIGQLKMFLAIYEAERDNKERSNTTLTRMKDRTLQGYYLFPIPQGYKRSLTPGAPELDYARCGIIQEVLVNIADGSMNKYEAYKYLLSKGYRTPTGSILKIDKFERNILKNDFYAGFITIESWGERFSKIKGLQQPLITEEQHSNILARLSNKRLMVRKKHNPEFPLNQIMDCFECGDGKLVGFFHSNGKGWKAPKYRCRKCGKQHKRDIVHDSLNYILKSLQLDDKNKKELLVSLEKVWNDNQQENIHQIKALEKRLIELKDKKNRQIETLSDHPELASDIKEAVENTKLLIKVTEEDIVRCKDIDKELADFIKFALDYLQNLMDHWWELDHDSRVKCKQLVFPEGFSVDSHQKVYTHKISPIFRFEAVQNEANLSNNDHLVELGRVALPSRILPVY